MSSLVPTCVCRPTLQENLAWRLDEARRKLALAASPEARRVVVRTVQHSCRVYSRGVERVVYQRA